MLDDIPSECRVVPFGNLRIKGYLHLPEAYRSLSRPSSPPRAKASAMRPCLLLVLPSRMARYILSACYNFTFFVHHVKDRLPVKGRVENNGFEPLTPCVQSRCSSQLS